MNKQKVSILVSAPSDNIPQLNCSIVFEELSRKVSVSRFKIIHRKTFTNSSICLLLSFAVGKKNGAKLREHGIVCEKFLFAEPQNEQNEPNIYKVRDLWPELSAKHFQFVTLASF